jgi:ATP-dependent helicase HrpA
MDELTITIPAELPIAERADELLASIDAHQVVIVAGETGSGKSTQLPKLCLALGRGADALIGHTQPRRVAARTVAERIADELRTPLGGIVGYSVRFTDRVGPATRVRVMTDGILLAEIQRDRLLRRYDTLIVDEAHERSLNVDLLIGYLRRLLPRRPDLKVIVTSATIDTERFAAHFATGGQPAPVITVSGRTYPVELRYRPPAVSDRIRAIDAALDELAGEAPGDVLVFLSGEREIRDTSDALKAAHPELEVLPLYARLSAPEQHRIFAAHRGRRVVLATNVAETSITVPGVRHVIDTGTARISRFSQRLKVQRLPIEPISQASANQRAGRCGRLGPGICIRLFDEDDFASRPAFTEPEIQRTNLAAVILQMTAAGLGDVQSFPFLDPPDGRAIRDGIALLHELGAVDDGSPLRLTPTGRRLARLPVDPRLGRMVIEAQRLGCVREVLVIASGLSIQDPRERPAEQRQAADEMHRRFAGSGSDFLAFVELFDHLRAAQRERSGAAFRRLCAAEYLHYLRVREWRDLYSQLRQIAGEGGIRPGTEIGHPDRVHQAVLAGLLSHIGVLAPPDPRRRGPREYRGARDARFVIAPGSAVRAGTNLPPWVMAAELVETDRLRARVVVGIQPEWVERVGAHLTRRSYGEPRWDRRRGGAVCTERVTMYGLPIVERTTGYERVDAVVAREMFVRHALVQSDWEGRGAHRVLTANDAVVADLHALGERSRRTVVDEEAVHAAYDRVLPTEVVSAGTFQRWLKSAGATALRLTPDALAPPGAPSAVDFPGEWSAGDVQLGITYRFDPDDPADGATIHVPLEALDALDSAVFGWHVPGFRDERIAALLQSLPKSVRRELAPMADTVRDVQVDLGARPPAGSFADALVASVERVRSVRLDPSNVVDTRLPAHLRVGFAVEGPDGRTLAQGKDLDALRVAMAREARAAVAAATPEVEQRGLTDWPTDLRAVVETRRDGVPVRGYPALVDDLHSVSVRVFTTPGLQARVMHAGVRRLLLLRADVARRAVQRATGNAVRLALGRLDIGLDAFAEDVVRAAADELISRHPPVIDEPGFRALQAEADTDLAAGAMSVGTAAGRVTVVAADVRARLDRLVAPSLGPSVDDARAHLDRLVRPGFVTRTGAGRLADLTRYVRALAVRLDKLGDDVERDRRRMVEVRARERRYTALLDSRSAGPVDSEATELGWMLEELRVAVFAQSLGAAKGTSATRVDRALQQLGAP